MIYEKIKAELIIARKARDSIKVTILSTILGEMNSKAVLDTTTLEKVVTDDTAMAVIKKTIKGIDETLTLLKPDADKSSYENEKMVLEGFLPTPLTEEEMKEELKGFLAINEGASFGVIMSHFKAMFPGRYDGKLLSSVVKANAAV
jgi:uncharacterized protein YqeY